MGGKEGPDIRDLLKIDEFLHSALELDQALCRILTALTAGEGFGFNRALLLLRKGEYFEGEKWIGPVSHEDAARIWEELERKKITLQEMLEQCGEKRENVLSKKAKEIKIHYEKLQGYLERKVRIGEPEFFSEILGTREFAFLPLIGRENCTGIILADNIYSGKKIEEIDVNMLEFYGAIAGAVIERALLYTELRKEKERYEQAYRKMKELQESTRRVERLAALGEATAMIAHELRNPLVIIGGYTDYIMKKLEPGEKLQEKLKVIKRTVRRLELALMNLSGYLKDVSPGYRSLPLSSVIQDTLLILGPEMEKMEIEVEKEIPEGLTVWGDPELLRHVFLNLLKNAVEACGRGGRIRIWCEERENEFVVSVDDSGPGVKREDVEEIFKPFFSRKSSGLGLGLSIVKKIVDAHGGRIEVKESPLGGASFQVYLPKGGEDEENIAR
ncbi:hypothetical protein DRQ16_00385 [bacterium]|nr:MAG: hypothetical protein DRQ16_00385 [bacterium]